MRRHRRVVLWVGLVIASAAGRRRRRVPPWPRAHPLHRPSSCLPAPPTDPDAPRAVDRDTVTDTAGNRLRVVEAPTGLDPAGIAVDATDAWGRVFVADRGSDQVTILYGRSPALTVACRFPVAGGPFDVAVDDQTGTLLVALSGAPAIGLLDGRTDPPSAIGSVELPDVPSHVALDQDGRRAWVTLPETGRVALLEPDPDDPTGATWSLTGTFEAGSYPTFLAVDPERQRLLVAAQGQPPDTEGDRQRGCDPAVRHQRLATRADRLPHPRERAHGCDVRPGHGHGIRAGERRGLGRVADVSRGSRDSSGGPAAVAALRRHRAQPQSRGGAAAAGLPGAGGHDVLERDLGHRWASRCAPTRRRRRPRVRPLHPRGAAHARHRARSHDRSPVRVRGGRGCGRWLCRGRAIGAAPAADGHRPVACRDP